VTSTNTSFIEARAARRQAWLALDPWGYPDSVDAASGESEAELAEPD
jgi:hypothetical protein